MSETETWPPSEVTKSLIDLKDLYGVVLSNRKSHKNVEANNYLSRYLTVRCCGHIEIATSECLIGFVMRHVQPSIEDYIRETYIAWKTPNGDYLKKMAKRVSRELERDLSRFLKEPFYDSTIGGSLTTLTKVRNSIAHGKNSAITVEAALHYYALAIKISGWYTERLAPANWTPDYQ